jgi:hypothetical protein
MQVEIKNFENETDNKFVGFNIRNDANALFVIDKRVPLVDGKTDEQYVQEALSLAQPEIDEWLASQSFVGRKWNTQTNSFE